MGSIAIVDYGVGNLGSIANMLKKLGVRAEITKEASALRNAAGIILPGVGHFDHCARELRSADLVGVLEERVREAKVPFLGICVGMQLLARSSEEGNEPGLGWVDADVRRFRLPPEERLPIPHMGWARVTPTASSCPLFGGDELEAFYFVHSFHMVCDHEASVAAHARYGYRFTAAVQKDNVLGTQFHPEKSHKYGLALMRRFSSMVLGRA